MTMLRMNIKSQAGIGEGVGMVALMVTNEITLPVIIAGDLNCRLVEPDGKANGKSSDQSTSRT
jgi:hypothetical protein